MHLRSAKEAWDKLKDLYNPVSDHSGRVIAVIAGVMGSDRLDRSDRHLFSPSQYKHLSCLQFFFNCLFQTIT
ncbi:hypothetical protein L249_7109 [Ophiocordyceps polyrhachis-furcata BCC 54312]|uniref:Uncharacterized protein n=1 Tax=Ophiocordyceps polyrhachis-furcata BCC 54312 TaxID=1330021 RepID=A0A367LKE4_9HYPO|nr:hypothetical protein L249_7109 [Ophiocordyceps polyrhachis-furcata BCC 54312]